MSYEQKAYLNGPNLFIRKFPYEHPNEQNVSSLLDVDQWVMMGWVDFKVKDVGGPAELGDVA